MKENKNTLLSKEKKSEKKQSSPLYTILDRYKNFCRQAKLAGGDIHLDDKYLERWFVY